RSSLSESYGAPVRSLSTQYGAPNSRNFESYASPKSSYLPSQFDSYSARNNALSAQYGLPDKSTNAVISSYASVRSNPSEKYGPSASKMPSEEYGAPDVYNSQSSLGYNYARNALDELRNQEPAYYDFDYKVNDIVSGSDFGHKETRQENKAEGSYFVVLPDGTKQVVEYEADERGFKPRISVEPAGFQGYDDNASDLARSGPY
ncbi:pro-resilin-like, partial [Leptidea sinapis]|uniref:pro-resilin-like n=1 Tax=Leptidea sinapis TaxID=189913 RepID=UPI0021C2E0DD